MKVLSQGLNEKQDYIHQLFKQQNYNCRQLFKKASVINNKTELSRRTYLEKLVKDATSNYYLALLKNTQPLKYIKYFYTLQAVNQKAFVFPYVELKRQDQKKQNNQSSIENINLLINQIVNGNTVVSGQCPRCLHHFYDNTLLDIQSGHKIFPIQFLNFQAKKQHQQFAQYICSALNHGSALIMIGMTKQNQIKGVTLEKFHLYQLEETIMGIRKRFIFPQPQQNEIIQISFDNINKSLQDNQKKSSYFQQKQIGIIKVYINTRAINRSYFLLKNDQNGKKHFIMWKKPNQKYLQSKIYQEMYKAFKKPKIKNLHYNIKCTRPEKEYQSKISKDIIPKEKELISTAQFGKQPVKKHQHHYIVVFNPKKNQINDFIQQLNKLGAPFEYYTIYEHLIKNTDRTVYYLSHSKRYEEVRRIAEEVDPKKKHLTLLKIKPHLTLLRQQFFQDAYQILQPKYRQCFGTDLQVRQKRNCSKKGVQCQFYFCFRSKYDMIFAFVCLEMANIRANFVSENKVEDATVYTPWNVSQARSDIVRQTI